MMRDTIILVALVGLPSLPLARSQADGSQCAAESILEACLSTQVSRRDACGSEDWVCLCPIQNDLVTCYNNCPNDTRLPHEQSKATSYCAAAATTAGESSAQQTSEAPAPTTTSSEPTIADPTSTSLVPTSGFTSSTPEASDPSTFSTSQTPAQFGSSSDTRSTTQTETPTSTSAPTESQSPDTNSGGGSSTPTGAIVGGVVGGVVGLALVLGFIWLIMREQNIRRDRSAASAELPLPKPPPLGPETGQVEEQPQGIWTGNPAFSWNPSRN
ncbi:hypothetical protein ABW19_dt0206732 [Dactylella cylindrospora]|nr:hypothetical protein ABW19_dt0206732 [Dactylella cylindrospora]